jgi:hypothetical protein
MTNFRFFAYLGPRLSQFLGWTFDTNSLTDPLLQESIKPKIPDRVYQLPMVATSHAMSYVPPPYNQLAQFPKLKG